MKQVQYVIVFVLRERKGTYELLLGLREPRKYMGGTWQLISGGIEPDEPAWRSALREVREETGLEAVDFFRLSYVTQFYRPSNDSMNVGIGFCVVVDCDAECVKNSEHTRLEWIAMEKAAERLMWPGDKTALEEVRTQIIGSGPALKHLRIVLR